MYYHGKNQMIHTVTDIIIYPVKGLGGIHLQEARALTSGFEFDRRWMLVDADGKFVSQRTVPKMALFSQKIENDQLYITFGESTFNFPLSSGTDERVDAKVWDDTAVTKIVSKEASQWFSDQINHSFRLVRMADENARIHYSKTIMSDLSVSLADGYPYLLIGEESLRNLNIKMSSPVKMSRFRPNIVVTTSAAHEEDTWGQLSIGTALFRNIKPCGRCNVITIDQENANIHPETLQVLTTYRKSNNNILFGTNMTCIKEGHLSVGDPINFL
jgi:uncharacterized protein YcbX